MKTDSGKTESVWLATADIPNSPPLDKSISTDVCIVGAGIAGLSVGYFLARKGKRVVILDDGPTGGGETCRTTGHLSNAFDDRYCHAEKVHGERGAQLIAESHTTAIAQIEAIVLEEKIECGFERLDGFLFVPPGESAEILEMELAAAHRAGLAEVEWVGRSPLAIDSGPCLRFPRQGQFHPLKYLKGLRSAIVRDGGKIFNGTRVEGVEGGNPAKVTTREGHVVSCGQVVVATNTPINDWVSMHTKQAAYRTFAIGVRVPRGSVCKALYWDTASPYHYLRVEPGAGNGERGFDLLIVGGEDHKTGQASERQAPFLELERWTARRFPQMEGVEFRWSGQVMEPVDHLAFIGRNPGGMENDTVFIVTGDSGQGLTHGTIAGILLTDLITGQENDWKTLYDPSRISLRSAGEFARQNLNVARQYTDWLTAGEVDSVEEIRPGNGAIVRRGSRKIAAFRDEQGELHERSAVCPHLGCIVEWNSVEKSWDCPCHGSRFQGEGDVVNGPAISGLPKCEHEAAAAHGQKTSPPK